MIFPRFAEEPFLSSEKKTSVPDEGTDVFEEGKGFLSEFTV